MRTDTGNRVANGGSHAEVAPILPLTSLITGALWETGRSDGELDRRWKQRAPFLHDDRGQTRRPS